MRSKNFCIPFTRKSVLCLSTTAVTNHVVADDESSPTRQFDRSFQISRIVRLVLNSELTDQRKIRLEKGPMDMAFHPDGKTVLIANQDAGSISVVSLDTAEILQTFKAGRGVETLSFF